jgi:hypothetical protein
MIASTCHSLCTAKYMLCIAEYNAPAAAVAHCGGISTPVSAAVLGLSFCATRRTLTNAASEGRQIGKPTTAA